MFPEGSDRRAISYLEGETVPKRRCIMAELIGKNVVGFVYSAANDWDMKALKFRAGASDISRRGVGVNLFT